MPIKGQLDVPNRVAISAVGLQLYDMVVVVIAVFVAGIVIGLIFRVRGDKK